MVDGLEVVKVKAMNTAQIKQQIIENFIDWWTSNKDGVDGRDNMKRQAQNYVAEDHVDEISDALGLHDRLEDYGVWEFCSLMGCDPDDLAMSDDMQKLIDDEQEPFDGAWNTWRGRYPNIKRGEFEQDKRFMSDYYEMNSDLLTEAIEKFIQKLNNQ